MGVRMSTIKRAVVLLVELAAEALLLGCLLGALVSNQIGFRYGAIGSVLAVPVVLFLHGYYLTRAFFGVIWRSQTLWAYPALAAALFVAHMHFAFVRLKPDLSPMGRATELPFLAGGACVVFACAFAGNRLLRRWTQAANKRTEPPARTNNNH
jgi:hypothetical protein